MEWGEILKESQNKDTDDNIRNKTRKKREKT